MRGWPFHIIALTAERGSWPTLRVGQEAPAGMKQFWTNTTGATAIEFALIASLIAMAILAGLSTTGSQTGALYNRIMAGTNTAR